MKVYASVSIALLALLASRVAADTGDDIMKGIQKTFNDIGKSSGSSSGGGSVKLNVNSDGISGTARQNENAFFYEECRAGVSLSSGFDSGCERKFTPLFYGCVAGGGVLALLLLSCCCCCCCAPCRKRRAAGAVYHPMMSPASRVVVVNAQPANPHSHDVPMLHA